jgi:hypothetical protein
MQAPPSQPVRSPVFSPPPPPPAPAPVPVPLPLGPAASDVDEGPSEEDERDFLDDADEGFESAGEGDASEADEEVQI